MISLELHNRIKAANKKHEMTSRIIGSIVIIGFFVISFVNNGWENWMLFLVAGLALVNIPRKGADTALRILMERSTEIESIEIEREKSAIELDIRMKGERREYEIKLPEKEGKELIVALKNELPNVQFINEKEPSLKDLFNQMK